MTADTGAPVARRRQFIARMIAPGAITPWLTSALLGPVPGLVALPLFGLLVLVVALQNTQPILDGDLFWHLAYAQQMLARHTLIPDATLYSWTPTSSTVIYCAWLAELTLYAIWSLAGLGGVFVLRFLVVATVLALVWHFARRCRIERSPVAFLVFLGLAELTRAGSAPKPELFSLLFFAIMVFAYSSGRIAVHRSRWLAWTYAVPLLLLIWVNTHGAFILAAPFLVATALGEVLLFARRSPWRLPGNRLLHLLAAWLLCGLATVATPYGLAYPIALIRENVLGLVARPDVAWNEAYLSIFSPLVTGEFIVGLVGLTIVSLGVAALAWRQRLGAAAASLPLGLAALAYIPLYIIFLRSTQFLPIVAGFFMLSVGKSLAAASREQEAPASKVPPSAVVGSAISVITLAAVVHAFLSPPFYGWIGFGIGENSPVREAEFLAGQKLGPDLYNVFDSGGYLLWRLHPAYRVMTDSRSFPYLGWFDDQFRFTNGDGVAAFLAKYPADVAVIDLSKETLWQRFMGMKDWRLAHYDVTAAIFVKRSATSAPTATEQDPHRFADVGSVGGAVQAYNFATFIGDYAAAAVLLDRLETTLRWRVPAEAIAWVESYRDAMVDIRNRDYAAALDALERAIAGRPVSDRDRVVLTMLVALVQTPDKLDAKGRAEVEQALEKIVPVGFQ